MGGFGTVQFEGASEKERTFRSRVLRFCNPPYASYGDRDGVAGRPIMCTAQAKRPAGDALDGRVTVSEPTHAVAGKNTAMYARAKSNRTESQRQRT